MWLSRMGGWILRKGFFFGICFLLFKFVFFFKEFFFVVKFWFGYELLLFFIGGVVSG